VGGKNQTVSSRDSKINDSRNIKKGPVFEGDNRNNAADLNCNAKIVGVVAGKAIHDLTPDTQQAFCSKKRGKKVR